MMNKKCGVIGIFLFSLLVYFRSDVFADRNIELLGKIVNGYPRNIVVQGSYAYVAAEGILSTIDISDVSNPEQTYIYDTPGTAFNLCKEGGYLYIACGDAGIEIVSIAVPAEPAHCATYNTPGYAKDICVQGNYAFIADSADGVHIIDISNPFNPVKKSIYSISSADGIYVSGTRAYVAISNAGLLMLDITDPAYPAHLDTIDTSGSASAVAVSGEYAYVADGDSGLGIFHISGSLLLPATYFNTSGHACDIFLSGTDAYVADREGGLVVVDISNPSNPAEKWRNNTPGGFTYGVYVSDQYAFIADAGNGIRIIDTVTPTEKGSLSGPGLLEGIAVSGNYAYAANHYNEGLYIIDISIPAEPVIVSSISTPSPALDVYVSSGYAYIADCGAGLRIIDISNPFMPSEAGFYNVDPDSGPSAGFAQGVYVSGRYAYIADGKAGLRIVDVSTIPNPLVSLSEKGYYDMERYANKVYVSGNHAYVACGNYSTIPAFKGLLWVIDISSPSKPSPTASYPLTGYALDVFVSGDYAYVAADTAGLRIIDISNPSNPQPAGYYQTSGSAQGVKIAGNYAYISYGGSGLRVVDISNPSSPQEIASYDTPGYAVDVSVSGRDAYVADKGAGMFILRPAVPYISTIIPNSGKNGDILDLMIEGENFSQNAAVEFSGTGITVSSVTWINENRIDVQVSISTDAVTIPGTQAYRDVALINGNGSTWIYPDAFTVNYFIDTSTPTPPSSCSINRQVYGYIKDILISWDVSTSSDPESGIHGYHLEVWDSSNTKNYFSGYILGKDTTNYAITIVNPDVLNDMRDPVIYASVQVVNGFGLKSTAAYSGWYDTYDSTPPSGKPTKPVFSQEYANNGQVKIRWDIGTCLDPESGIIGYHLLVGDIDDPIKQYFNGNVMDTTAIIQMPMYQLPTIFAVVQAINGSGLRGEGSTSDRYTVILAVPTISEISPSWGKKRSDLTVTIRGTNFTPVSSVIFGDPGITVKTLTYVDPSTLAASITISKDAQIGATDVTVSNLDPSSVTLADGFEIREGLADSPGKIAIQGGADGYVNPSKGETVLIHFNANAPGTVHITIYTLKGMKVWEESTDADGGEDFHSWDCRNSDHETVASGIYVIYVKGPGIQDFKKAAVIK